VGHVGLVMIDEHEGQNGQETRGLLVQWVSEHLKSILQHKITYHTPYSPSTSFLAKRLAPVGVPSAPTHRRIGSIIPAFTNFASWRCL
jgi:hypothetical protein